MVDELQPGDIALYVSSGTVPDRMVARATGGPYVHCAVVLTPNLCVEALAHGVVEDPLRRPDGVLATGVALTADGLAHGLKWLMERVGDQYSLFDIVADGVKAILPQSLSNTPFLVAPSQFDCSQLCVDFLMAAGYEWLPYDWYASANRVSPNDLARALPERFHVLSAA